MNQQPAASPKLFMVLLGANPPGRNVEQHDYFFGIGTSLRGLIPSIKDFWPEAGNTLHLDGWREINYVDGFRIEVVDKDKQEPLSPLRLFFINLGGYREQLLEEQHYTVLSVHQERLEAIKESKKTVFFKTNTFKGATSHIDEKFGIDVDDIYRIEDILAPEFKERYHIRITPDAEPLTDPVTLGYFKLDKIP